MSRPKGTPNIGNKLWIGRVKRIKAELKTAKHGDGKGIAKAYGISPSMLSKIKHGKYWRDA